MHMINMKQAQTKEKFKPQTTLNTHNKSNTKPKHSISDADAIKILQEVDRLLATGQSLQGINLLRALKDNMQTVKNNNISMLVFLNLGILYYQVGFLQEANQEFSIVIPKLKQMSQKLLQNRTKDMLRIKFETILARLELQICILYSQLGKHDLALQHAKTSSKIHYNLIYDILAKLYSSLNKQLVSKNYPKKEQQQICLQESKGLLNNIGILNHLLNCTKDLKLAYGQKERISILEEQTQITRKYGFVSTKFEIDQLYDSDKKVEHFWIYKNKILDEIQLTTFDLSQLQDLDQDVTNNQVIQKITFLAISLYCYSTQTRFVEKQKNCDPRDVLDSQHWLSRSLQIAYSFLPAQAPILSQIITVHDRFHGLDKQTIPQDEEVAGFFKVLKPLSKPKSTYNPKSAGCSPIMIRIQADKVDLQVEEPSVKTQRQLPISKNVLELDQQERLGNFQNLTKNNKIKIYSHGHKRVETIDAQIGRPYLASRNTIDTAFNIRSNYVSKKFGQKKKEKFRLNFTELNGKAVISEDLLSRPHSIQDKGSEKEESHRSFSQSKKKSLPSKKNELTRKPNTLGNTIKLQGLELKGHKMQDSGMDGQFFQRLNDQRMIETTTRFGGNVYINNNINLFISRNAQPNHFTQTFVRGQVLGQKQKNRDDKQKQMSRRQIFLNKRRANNFISPEEL